MALVYSSLADQIAAALRISRKAEAAWIHWDQSDNANYNPRLVKDNLDETSNDENDAEDLAVANLISQSSTLANLFTNTRALFENMIFTIIDNDLPTSDEDISDGAIVYKYDDVLLANGQVSILRRAGRLGALYHDMVLNTEEVLENGIAFGALTAAGGNTGTAVFSVSPTGSDHTLGGTFTLKCIDDTVGATRFSVNLNLTTPLPDTEDIAADNELTLAKSYEDGPTGLSMTLGLGAVSESGDDGAMISAITITNPNEIDSNKGQHFIRVTRQATAPIWLIEWFNDSSLDPTTKVGSATSDTVLGTDAISMLGFGGATVAFTFDRVAANVQLPAATNTDDDIVLDILNPRLNDEWTFTVTNDEAGNYATKLAHLYRASFNSNAAETGNWTDAQAASIAMT